MLAHCNGPWPPTGSSEWWRARGVCLPTTTQTKTVKERLATQWMCIHAIGEQRGNSVFILALLLLLLLNKLYQLNTMFRPFRFPSIRYRLKNTQKGMLSPWLGSNNCSLVTSQHQSITAVPCWGIMLFIIKLTVEILQMTRWPMLSWLLQLKLFWAGNQIHFFL